MKRRGICICVAALFLLTLQTAAQAASKNSIDNNEYFCVGIMAGVVKDYVPAVRLILDKFSFGDNFFNLGGTLAIEGLNDASGFYSVEDDDFGLEKISATCSAYDSDKHLSLHFAIRAVNLGDLGIIGRIELDGEIKGDDAGSAVGFFFGIRNLLD